jgi:hypothetical protein
MPATPRTNSRNSKESMSTKPSSSALIREAIDARGSSPKEIAAWVQAKHGVEVKPSLIHNVKHTYAKQSASAKHGRPRKEDAATAAPVAKASAGGSLAVEDIIAVKELVDRFGKESLTRLVEIL